MAHDPPPAPEALKAFAEYERQVTIQNYRVACLLGMFFMPAGCLMDLFVQPGEVFELMVLRLSCSVLLAVVWVLLGTARGVRHYRALGLIEVFLPLLFISIMIAWIKGFQSTYYAGLNLVLMGAGLVLRWGLRDSITVLAMALALYLSAGTFHAFFIEKPEGLSDLANNLFFLVVTGVFTITGNYFYNRLRFQEFGLRFELDQSRRKLEEGNRKLRELDEVKSRFFANVSHELRTPLTLLLSPLEALLARAPEFDGQTQDWLQTMHSNGLRLLKLINDLLELVRLESGRVEVRREEVRMPEFVTGLAQSVRKTAQDRRVQLEATVAPGVEIVLVDVNKLEKILLNLVFNALKFTPAGGRVGLSVEAKEEWLVFLVSDTGVGIEESQLPFVFDRFWQADTSARRKHQGVGIGTALVKELTELQGGKVTVRSRFGEGTVFEVRLPLLRPGTPSLSPAASGSATAAQPVAAEEKSAASVEDSWLSSLYRRAELFPSLGVLQETLRPVETGTSDARPRILLADDEPDMLRFVRSQLEHRYQVLEAVDGQQAIDKASQFLPDLVLCDMMMPEKDGLQVCRELRKRTPTQSVPIVLLTARADEETKIAALTAGASDFLTKPFSRTELHVRLKNLVDAYQLQKQISRQKQVLEATVEQLKETETQLVQTEKMASLGRMSAGIIHEINNPLNFIKSGLFALGKKGSAFPEPQRAEFEEVLKDIEEGINRVKDIVSELRTFAHPTTNPAAQIDTVQLVRSALRLLSHEWKNRVRVDLDIPSDHVTQGNRNKLVQVLINLFQNSLDAVKRKTYQGEEPALAVTARRDGGRDRIVIRDNGVGISNENRGKIFEPFFTTKDVGEGMGLGLSICYRIMEEHGGRILVDSEPGKYSEFTLELPAPVS